MAGKFYAVKEGRSTGVFASWAECKKQVDGYSGAKYKSFTSIDVYKRQMLYCCCNTIL